MIMFLYLFADHTHAAQTRINRRSHTNSVLNHINRCVVRVTAQNFPLLESLDEQRRSLPAQETDRLTGQP